MNNLVKYGMLAVYVGAGAMVASPAAMAETNQQMSDEIQALQAQLKALQSKVDAKPVAPAPLSPSADKSAQAVTAGGSDGTVVTAKGATLNLGGLKITPGGFLAAEGVFRGHNETADINSDFKGYPFRSNDNYYSDEFRLSARQSRVQLLVEAPSDGINKVEGFIASDFLGSGTTSNQNQSNSYVLRVREAYATWARTDYNFYLLAGQSWSMATMYKKGLNPRSENIPLTIDAQYVVGFNWLRTPQFRVVKNFGSLAAVGLSVENPQNQVKGTAPAGALVPNAGDNAGLLNNPSATYSTDVAPDITFKVALDPGWGHYEAYSLTRIFHDRAEGTPGTLNTEKNNNSVAEAFGAGMILPVLPKIIDFQASGLIGHGGGRYGSAQLGDSAYNPSNGSTSALKSQSVLVGLVAHPTSRLDVYGYGGYEHIGSASGYGNGVTATYASCQQNFDTLAAAAPACAANISTAKELTGGFWWKFYKGPIGYLTTGAQIEYNNIRTFEGKDGTQGKTDDFGLLWSFRYYPYQ